MNTVASPTADGASLIPREQRSKELRFALRMTCTLATILAFLGITVLGFEHSVYQLVFALSVGYSVALILEQVDAWTHHRPARFLGRGVGGFVSFLLSAHMTSLTTWFLLFVTDRYWALGFVVVAGITSKYLFRVEVDGRLRHFYNPSNFGIVVALLCFPSISVGPNHYTEFLRGWWNLVPVFIVLGLGLNLNLRFVRRGPLISAFLVGWLMQAGIRSACMDMPFFALVGPISGFPFLLFIFYMITDPMTSPEGRREQWIFGLAIAAFYGLLTAMHIRFGMFFAVFAVCSIRGARLWLRETRRVGQLATAP